MPELMPPSVKTERICARGHRYLKSSDCPVCPVCEREKGANRAYPFPLAAPARRALEHAGITSLRMLAGYTEADILALHGMGRKGVVQLKEAMQKAGLRFQPPGKTKDKRNQTMKKNKVPATIDEYIAGFPGPVQEMMQQIRSTIHRAAPGVAETIKYAMPAFTLRGNLVFFAGYNQHIGFYPAPVNHPAFAKALAGYKTGRGSVQFPLHQTMPLALVTRIVKHRVKEQMLKK